MMLAQEQLSSIDAAWWKNFSIALLVLVGLLVSVLGIVAFFRKPAPVRLQDDPAIEVRKAPKRFNHELAEQRHEEHSRRLNGHDAEIEQLWNTMRAEDASIRKQNGEKFESIMQSLGRIEGELGVKKK